MQLIRFVSFAIAIIFSAFCLAAPDVKTEVEEAPMPVFPSSVITESEAKTEEFEWGTLVTYFSKETYGTEDALAAIAIINPGMEIHPPHVHAEEEYLMVLEGRGEWHLLGRDFAASEGDMLYAGPWDIHGIKNTGKLPLKFVVWKWNSKGLRVAKEPEL